MMIENRDEGLVGVLGMLAERPHERETGIRLWSLFSSIACDGIVTAI